MSDHKKSLPIGYWLKRADELLTAQIGETQRANGLTRLEWQVLKATLDVLQRLVGNLERGALA